MKGSESCMTCVLTLEGVSSLLIFEAVFRKLLKGGGRGPMSHEGEGAFYQESTGKPPPNKPMPGPPGPGPPKATTAKVRDGLTQSSAASSITAVKAPTTFTRTWQYRWSSTGSTIPTCEETGRSAG